MFFFHFTFLVFENTTASWMRFEKWKDSKHVLFLYLSNNLVVSFPYKNILEKFSFVELDSLILFFRYNVAIKCATITPGKIILYFTVKQ